MKRIVLLFLFIFAFNGISFAEDKIYIDNEEIQEYKGKVGQWNFVESHGKMLSLLKKYYITIDEVKDVNSPTFSYNNYIFIPYSDKYINEIKLQNKERKTAVSTQNEFIWPLLKVDSISSSFGMRNRQFHTGTDIPASKGIPVIAVMDGRILSAGYDGGFGNSIWIEHRNNFFTRYAHNSVNLVKKGDYVKKGQIIGFVGSTGRSTGNHLHFEIRYNDVPLNPLDFLPYKENLDKVHQLRNWK